MYRNPDVLPYLSDTPPTPSQYKEAQRTPQFTWREWGTVLTPSVQGLVLDHYQKGDPIPEVVNQQLELIATRFNVRGGGQALLQLIGQSLGR